MRLQPHAGAAVVRVVRVRVCTRTALIALRHECTFFLCFLSSLELCLHC